MITKVSCRFLFVSFNIVRDFNDFEVCFETVFFVDDASDRITIFNEIDFGIYLEQGKTNKVFVVVPSDATSKQRSTNIKPKCHLNDLLIREVNMEKFAFRMPSYDEIFENSKAPTSQQPSTSKLNEGVLEQKNSPFGRMINEKLTEPMRVMSVKSSDEDLPGNISKDIDLPPSEPLHDKSMVSLNSE